MNRIASHIHSGGRPTILGATAIASVTMPIFRAAGGRALRQEGFQVREDYWGGDLAAGEKKAVRQQLSKARILVLAGYRSAPRKGFGPYLRQGRKLIEQPIAGKKGLMPLPMRSTSTDSYFIIVAIEESPEETHPLGAGLRISVKSYPYSYSLLPF